jgi:hypothetical protein
MFTSFCFVRFAFQRRCSSDFFLCCCLELRDQVWTILTRFFFMMSDVHKELIVGCQCFFFFPFPSGYNIGGSFVLVDCCKMFFYGSSAIIACSLNQIIRLPDLIRSNRVNNSSIKFFLLLHKYCDRLGIFFVC